MTGKEHKTDIKEHNNLQAGFDPEAYLHYIEDLDLTEEEARQLLEVWFQIVLQFVDLGWGLHPIQQSCGQVGKGACDFRKADSDVLISEEMLGAIDENEGREAE